MLELGPPTSMQVLPLRQETWLGKIPLLATVQVAPPSVVRTEPPPPTAMHVLTSGQAIPDGIGALADCWIQVVPPSVVLRIRIVNTVPASCCPTAVQVLESGQERSLRYDWFIVEL